ncbi:hypothetical protein EDF52_105164 [Curtobacterium sp. PhB42]|uniref:hypothetical protein n=1 Tax=unclassified Curtobacterium TaxID=257496 RepID=UPI0010633A64|nr:MULTISPECIES: hypothetical protein [unclassified Curtobacterium]TDW48344.1 hypothetical protein EDF52_105164 [Curtobacterium sp. PhB42]TDW53815.1 hypothetical protein EDF47_108112 [Curtobacterium sp. PhB190]
MSTEMGTSTETGTSTERTDRRPVTRRFHRRYLAVVLVLAVVAALAAVAGSQQGPRLRDVSYDATGLVSRPAQRVILTANQALQQVSAADVRVSPAAAHTVTSSGNTIAVEFAGPLAYDRDYTVTVANVRAPGQRATADLTAAIRTGSTDVLALVPGADGAKDRIVRRSLDAGGATTVYQGTDISEYARLGRSLVVVSGSDASSSVDVVALSGGVQDPDAPVEHLTLPSSHGRVTALHVADDAASFGFEYADTSTGQSRNTGLYVVDMTGTHLPTAIAEDGKPQTGAVPMTVGQWAYVPRTESALVRTGSDDLVLVDMSGRADPVRLGSATYLHGFVGSGTTAVVETGTGIERLDLTDGAKTALRAPAASTDAAVLGRIAPLTDDTYLRVLGDVRSDGTVSARIVRVDGGRASRLPVTIPDDASVTAVCPSPNGQFVAVATKSATDELVSIVDATSGALEASIDAGSVDWCGALPSGDEVG